MMPGSPAQAPSPFLPGAGSQPPYLAGRADEQAELRQRLAWLRHDQGAPADVVLIGPRGNGKTVLLGWLARELRDGRSVNVLEWTPSHIPTLGTMTAELLPDSVRQRVKDRVESVSVAGHGMVLRKGDRPAAVTSSFRDALAVRCGQRPLAVLLDEAHMLDVDVGRDLLNLSQEVQPSAISAGAGRHPEPADPPESNGHVVLEPGGTVGRRPANGGSVPGRAAHTARQASSDGGAGGAGTGAGRESGLPLLSPVVGRRAVETIASERRHDPDAGARGGGPPGF